VRRLYEKAKPAPHFSRLHEDLQLHPHLTLQLAWEEYHQFHPDGYAYSRFCELYRRWRRRLDVVPRPSPSSRPAVGGLPEAAGFQGAVPHADEMMYAAPAFHPAL
jgi:hypothetical protein